MRGKDGQRHRARLPPFCSLGDVANPITNAKRQTPRSMADVNFSCARTHIRPREHATRKVLKRPEKRLTPIQPRPIAISRLLRTFAPLKSALTTDRDLDGWREFLPLHIINT